MTKVNFLSNREILAEMHRCKISYCSFIDRKFSDYDAIVQSLDAITDEFIQKTMLKKSAALTPKGEAPVEVAAEGLTFRVMTYEHIPPTTTKHRSRAHADARSRERVNFPPFKHYAIIAGELVEVGRSHWTGDLATGHFSATHGRLTDRFGRMLMMMVERYSRRGNWRGYSYLSELRDATLLHLCEAGLKFDEGKSDNPFAFLTTVMSHCFIRNLNIEKKHAAIRDELLVEAGAMPSMTRQINDAMTSEEFAKKIPRKRGRKSAKELAAKAAFEAEGSALR